MSRSSNADAQVRKNWGDADPLPGPMNGAVGLGLAEVPGGHFVLGTPYHGYLKNLAIAVLGKWDEHHGVHWEGGHIKFYSVQTLRDLVRAAGYTVGRFHYYGRMPWFWKNMICVARKPGA